MDDQTTLGLALIGMIIFLSIFRGTGNQSGKQLGNLRPAGYSRLPPEKTSDWVKWQAREHQFVCDEFGCPTNKPRTGYKYINGKNYSYAIYYTGNGKYTVFRKRRY